MKIFTTTAVLCLMLISCKQNKPSTQLPIASDAVRMDLLKEYVEKPDESYRYELLETIDGESHTEYIIKMVSGQWLTEEEVDETEWWHYVNIIKPDEVNQSEAMMIIGGGASHSEMKPSNENLVQAAIATKSVMAQISNVPFQPLNYKKDDLEEVYEDAIIAYGWKRFLDGGAKDADVEWLARLPMTRAVCRAMDVVQEFSLETNSLAIDSFFVAGASKRGWTTWTTAAVDDRVMAIAPIVIDLLNVVPSFNHHWRVYGSWSPAIQDYIDNGVMEWQGSKEYDRLLELVEPYSFIDSLDMPKFMVNATGDEFFVTDSWQFYWDDLKGDNYVQYVPNANHSLNGSYNLGSMVAFYNYVINDIPLPKFDWSVDGSTINLKLDPSANFKVTKWEAHNEKDRDFRVAVIGEAWKPTDIGQKENGLYEVEIAAPEKGYRAGMLEIVFNPGTVGALTFTTGTVVSKDTYPFESFVPEKPQGTRE